MQIDFVTTDTLEFECDAILVAVFLDEPLPTSTSRLDVALGGVISSFGGMTDNPEVRGTVAEVVIFHASGQIGAKRVVTVGLGRRGEIRLAFVRQAVGTAIRKLRDLGCTRIASILHVDLDESQSKTVAESSVDGALTADWEPGFYRSDPVKHRMQSFTLLVSAETGDNLGDAVFQGIVIGEAVNLARDLVNEPANRLGPIEFADRISTAARDAGVDCTILDEAAMLELGMNGMMQVSAGSAKPPRMVVLRIGPKDVEPKVALVGKGITFDTGGISIKPTDGMGAMKGDMAGAAAVCAALIACARLGYQTAAIAIAACAENMPDGAAYRPGDVIKLMNGKTAEIITTDAEGRIVLADALVYAARELKALALIDAATLTGACVVALGHISSGMFCNNEELLACWQSAADHAGERYWRLPLWDEYRDPIKSDIADLKNSGGRPGGAISAAMFLKEFSEGLPWLHLDIAGTSRADAKAHHAAGPTGVGVRSMVAYIHQLELTEA